MSKIEERAKVEENLQQATTEKEAVEGQLGFRAVPLVPRRDPFQQHQFVHAPRLRRD